jgi:hypothetical protein
MRRTLATKPVCVCWCKVCVWRERENSCECVSVWYVKVRFLMTQPTPHFTNDTLHTDCVARSEGRIKHTSHTADDDHLLLAPYIVRVRVCVVQCSVLEWECICYECL